MFIKYCVFSLNVVIFLNSASSAVALVFYLSFGGPSMKPGVHTEEKPREARVRNIFQNLRKNTKNTTLPNFELCELIYGQNLKKKISGSRFYNFSNAYDKVL